MDGSENGSYLIDNRGKHPLMLWTSSLMFDRNNKVYNCEEHRNVLHTHAYRLLWIQKPKRYADIFFTNPPLSVSLPSPSKLNFWCLQVLTMPSWRSAVILCTTSKELIYHSSWVGRLQDFYTILTWHVPRWSTSSFEFIDTFLRENLYTFETIWRFRLRLVPSVQG